MARVATGSRFLIYEPDSLTPARLDALETALELDRARILYAGSDGSRNYVIVEAASFKNTQQWSDGAGVPLVFQERGRR